MRISMALVLLALCATAQAQSRFLDSNAKAIEELLVRNFRDANSGMAIGLIDESGSRVFCRGKLGNGTEATIDGNTIFELGSVTKVFTSLLLVDAVRRAEVGFADPVIQYMPDGVEIPAFRGIEVTLLNLAVQDSGLPWNTPRQEVLLQLNSGEPNFEAYKKESSAFTTEKLYAFLATHELDHAPGEKFQYSNVGMSLLGHAIERAAGRNYGSLVVDRICLPLRMTDTCLTLTTEQKTRLAQGHMVDGSVAKFWKLQAMKPAGGLLSTTNDMLKFLGANIGLINSHLTPLMKQTQVNRHTGSKDFGRTAMPWFDNGVYNPPGTDLMGHSGGGVGSVAFVAFDAKNRRGVVVLTNQMKVSPYPIGWTLIQQMPFTQQNTAHAVRQIVGIGIGLEKVDPTSDLRITRVFPDSPAGKASITTAMVITHIGKTPVVGKSIEECYGLISGEADTHVQLTLRDPGGMEHEVDLTRRLFITNS